MARRSDHSREELRNMALDAALQIVRDDGFQSLSARRVAKIIGYTPGTIYLMFKNFDDLVQEMNAQTLDRLFDTLVELNQDLDTGRRLRNLAAGFLSFTADHAQEWDAVISYPFSANHQWAEYYTDKVEHLLGLMRQSVEELYSDDERHLIAGDVRVLWSSFYGIFALDSSNRLGLDQTVKDQIERLISIYIASRRSA